MIVRKKSVDVFLGNGRDWMRLYLDGFFFDFLEFDRLAAIEQLLLVTPICVTLGQVFLSRHSLGCHRNSKLWNKWKNTKLKFPTLP